jgi:plastocyanin
VHSLRRAPVRDIVYSISRWGVVLAVIPVVAACAPTPARTAPAPTAAPATAAVPAPSPGSAGSPVALAGASVAVVSMTDALRFEPASLTIAKGTTVTWRNSSQTIHTVTDEPTKASNKADAALPSGAQPWDSGNLNPGQTFSHTFDTPGTYKYFCIPHEMAGMTGTIVVTGS